MLQQLYSSILQRPSIKIVKHTILVKKLQAPGVTRLDLDWFISCLDNRQQQVFSSTVCSRRPNTSYQGFSKARLWVLYVSWSTSMTSLLVSLTPSSKCSLTTLSGSDSSKNADEILMKTLNVYPLRWIKLNGPSVKHAPRSVSTWSLVHQRDFMCNLAP